MIASAGARIISQSTEIIVCECNYLLSRQAPWDRPKPIFDLTVFVDVDESNLRQRLRGRWQSYGLAAEDIAQKVEEIDLPNGRVIIAGSSAGYPHQQQRVTTARDCCAP